MQAPRVNYLPLILPEVRRFLGDVVFEEGASKDLKDEDRWFETAEGTLLKWRVFEFISYRSCIDLRMCYTDTGPPD